MLQSSDRVDVLVCPKTAHEGLWVDHVAQSFQILEKRL